MKLILVSIATMLRLHNLGVHFQEMGKVHFGSSGKFASLALCSTRQLHYKANHKKYPKVNIGDVELEKPRYGFRKVRQPLLSLQVTDTMFPAGEIKRKYLEHGKPVPIKFNSKSDDISRRNYEKFQDELAQGLPHFKVGEKQVYFPKARICLLRPNAKHTPYQAKFLVPRNFNKMDLRDYLWHVYGLRALNVTVQLLHASFTRGMDDHARYRGPQYKKMTIDMAEPFVWPELPQHVVENARKFRRDQTSAMQMVTAQGSDKHKPNDSFDGIYKKPVLADIFVSSKNKKAYGTGLERLREQEEAAGDRKLVANYLEL